MRKIWDHEVDAAHGSTRMRYIMIRSAVSRGEPLAEALRETGGFFPPLFCELVEVGEQSGHLAEVLRQLAENYNHQITLRRKLRSELAYPVIQLAMALSIIGGVIWLMGLIKAMTGQEVDILGFGLVGTPGLIVYLAILGAIGLGGVVLWQNIRRGMLWTRPLQALIMNIPALSAPLVTLALARLTWSLALTMEAGMELRQALSLSLRSTHTFRFVDQIDPIWRSIRSGSELHEAMATTGVFPPRLTDAVGVGERSGRLSETMQLLSDQYQDEARAALAVLAKIAGIVVWMGVATMIIFFIFRIASFYVGILNNAARGKF